MKRYYFISLYLIVLLLFLGCTPKAKSVVGEVEIFKDSYDFEYVIPSYLPKGFKLISETYSLPKKVEFDNGGEYSSSGYAEFEFMNPPISKIKLTITSIPTHTPIDTSNNQFEVKGAQISVAKTEHSETIYSWIMEKHNSIYYLQTENDLSIKEVKKIINSIVTKKVVE